MYSPGGRKGYHSPLGVYYAAGNKSAFWGLCGGLSALTPLVISMYYIFVEAWCLLYALQYVPVSYLLCRIYERTNSIWGSILLHMFSNFVALHALTALERLL